MFRTLEIKAVFPGLLLGVEICLVYYVCIGVCVCVCVYVWVCVCMYVYSDPKLVKYNSNYTRAAKRPACIIGII